MNEIIQGDCLEVMNQFADNSFDCIITDPVWPNALTALAGSEDPYGLFEKAARHFPRLARTVIIHLGCTSDPRFLLGIPQELPFLRTCWLRYNFPSYRGRLLVGSDVAYVFGAPPKARKGNHVLKGEFVSKDSYMNIQIKRRGPHPTPRKIEHILGLVDVFTNEGDTILDPFAGSGTTCVAAKYLKRNFIGIEINKKYCDSARSRLAQEMLF